MQEINLDAQVQLHCEQYEGLGLHELLLVAVVVVADNGDGVNEDGDVVVNVDGDALK